MKLLSYILLGMLIFFVVVFISINFSSLIGNGENSEVTIISAIAILCSIVVICTLVIKDEINNFKK